MSVASRLRAYGKVPYTRALARAEDMRLAFAAVSRLIVFLGLARERE